MIDNDGSCYKHMGLQDLLKRLMIEKGVTTREVAAGTGLSTSGINQILMGVITRPQPPTVKKLADYFGVAPSYLLGGDEGPRRPSSEDRLRALEGQLAEYATWPPPPDGVDVETKKFLYEKYVKGELVAFRLEELDAEGVEMIYKLLLRFEREEKNRGGTIRGMGA